MESGMPTVKFDYEKCKGCGLCVAHCPRKIIKMTKKINAGGYQIPAIEDAEKCIACTCCAIVCPDSVIEVDEA
jgi:2-oxoglutarate ferredoxin oxidoreductase subunit delta